MVAKKLYSLSREKLPADLICFREEKEKYPGRLLFIFSFIVHLGFFTVAKIVIKEKKEIKIPPKTKRKERNTVNPKPAVPG